MRHAQLCLERWHWYRVELTDRHINYAHRIADARVAVNKRRKRRGDPLGTPFTEIELYRRGALAEVAVAIAEDTPIRLPVHDGSHLLRAGAGPDVGSWQVKFSGSKPPSLIVPVHQWWKQCNSPYLLVTHDPSEHCRLYIVGWISATELFKSENIQWCFGRFNAYVAPQLQPYVPWRRRCGTIPTSHVAVAADAAIQQSFDQSTVFNAETRSEHESSRAEASDAAPTSSRSPKKQ